MYLNYNDIVLVPKYSPLFSRSQADVSTVFGNKIFKLPVLPANMTSTINNKLAFWLSENGYFYSMHRFNGRENKKDLYWFINKANEENWKNISISIGIKEDDIALTNWILMENKRVDFITIDIAHGHSIVMKENLINLKILFSNIDKKPFIIAGNVGTPEAILDLEHWGADATKIGLAYGKACITKNKTGFATPMFSTILECSKRAKKPIIADGSISENGDITKALVAGANMVMCGSIFAACKDSPAETRCRDIYHGKGHIPAGETIVEKIYYGSASKENGNIKNIEGTEIIIPCNQMTYQEKLIEIEQDLQSSISYAGGTKISDFNKVQWRIIK